MNKTIVLITGANSGIGFELAAQLLTKPSYHILVAARSVEKGKAAVRELQGRQLAGSSEFLHLDVTDDDTITHATASVEDTHGRLDILVNNAAIGRLGSSRNDMQDSFNTNATGPLLLSQAFLPLLERSKRPRIINVSSGMGSISRRLDTSSPSYNLPAPAYRASKAALSMVTASQHVEYGDRGIKVFAYDPGFTVSNLGEHNNEANGARKTADSVRPLVDVLEGGRDAEAGKLLHNEGHYPW